MRYRKRPLEVEAIQYTGPKAIHKMKEVWPDFTNHSKFISLLSSGDSEPVTLITIHTPEGVLSVRMGDYVVRGIEGEFYPCKKDIFEESYVKLSGECGAV